MFGPKYTGRKHIRHIHAILAQHFYIVEQKWKGDIFCILSLDWGYEKVNTDVSMPRYVKNTLFKF